MTSPTPRFTTNQAAQRIGVHKATLLDWLAKGLIREPARDRRNWRVWSEAEIDRVIAWNSQVRPCPRRSPTRSQVREAVPS